MGGGGSEGGAAPDPFGVFSQAGLLGPLRAGGYEGRPGVSSCSTAYGDELCPGG
jgi:hypothetical protein